MVSVKRTARLLKDVEAEIKTTWFINRPKESNLDHRTLFNVVENVTGSLDTLTI